MALFKRPAVDPPPLPFPNTLSTNPHGMLYTGSFRDAVICAVSGMHSCPVVIGQSWTEPPSLQTVAAHLGEDQQVKPPAILDIVVPPSLLPLTYSTL